MDIGPLYSGDVRRLAGGRVRSRTAVIRSIFRIRAARKEYVRAWVDRAAPPRPANFCREF